MKSLKCEEVYRNEYDSFEEMEAAIGRYIEQDYNIERLHSAIGYTAPTVFEEKRTTFTNQQPTITASKKSVSL